MPELNAWKDRSPGLLSGLCWVLGDGLAMVHRKPGSAAWFVTCRRMSVDSTKLVSIDADEAKAEAMRYLRSVLVDLNLKFAVLHTAED